jgi:hypothetical protein
MKKTLVKSAMLTIVSGRIIIGRQEGLPSKNIQKKTEKPSGKGS